jgi:hypothetical protein
MYLCGRVNVTCSWLPSQKIAQHARQSLTKTEQAQGATRRSDPEVSGEVQQEAIPEQESGTEGENQGPMRWHSKEPSDHTGNRYGSQAAQEGSSQNDGVAGRGEFVGEGESPSARRSSRDVGGSLRTTLMHAAAKPRCEKKHHPHCDSEGCHGAST